VKDCLFCKIISKEIPAHVVYEDGDVLAFLDINPSAPGHTVLIPKEHCPDIQRMPDKLIRPVFTAVKRVILLLGETMGSAHFTIGFNNGRLSGQEIDHIHVHLIPRYEGDGGSGIQSVVSNPSKEDLIKIKNKILKADG
jgi:histidine triad (HIT) family protein